jgi:hypothetical protein
VNGEPPTRFKVQRSGFRVEGIERSAGQGPESKTSER